MSGERPQEFCINEKWDACIDLALRRIVYGTLGGGAAALILFSELLCHTHRLCTCACACSVPCPGYGIKTTLDAVIWVMQEVGRQGQLAPAWELALAWGLPTATANERSATVRMPGQCIRAPAAAHLDAVVFLCAGA